MTAAIEATSQISVRNRRANLSCLTVKLDGRQKTLDARYTRTIFSSRVARLTTFHGPFRRLLEGLAIPAFRAHQTTRLNPLAPRISQMPITTWER